ncbi:MAG: hypothetical protein Q8Q20_03445 [bacterium]|nr:hypothetical protein [bacterium]
MNTPNEASGGSTKINVEALIAAIRDSVADIDDARIVADRENWDDLSGSAYAALTLDKLEEPITLNDPMIVPDSVQVSLTWGQVSGDDEDLVLRLFHDRFDAGAENIMVVVELDEEGLARELEAVETIDGFGDVTVHLRITVEDLKLETRTDSPVSISELLGDGLEEVWEARLHAPATDDLPSDNPTRQEIDTDDADPRNRAYGFPTES